MRRLVILATVASVTPLHAPAQQRQTWDGLCTSGAARACASFGVELDVTRFTVSVTNLQRSYGFEQLPAYAIQWVELRGLAMSEYDPLLSDDHASLTIDGRASLGSFFDAEFFVSGSGNETTLRLRGNGTDFWGCDLPDTGDPAAFTCGRGALVWHLPSLPGEWGLLEGTSVAFGGRFANGTAFECDSATSCVVARPGPIEDATLTLVAWNINAQRRGPIPILAALDADIYAISEIGLNGALRIFADSLASATGRCYDADQPIQQRPSIRSIGLIYACALGLHNTRLVPHSDGDSVTFRMAVATEFRLGSADILLVAVHLAAGRDAQARSLRTKQAEQIRFCGPGLGREREARIDSGRLQHDADSGFVEFCCDGPRATDAISHLGRAIWRGLPSQIGRTVYAR